MLRGGKMIPAFFATTVGKILTGTVATAMIIGGIYYVIYSKGYDQAESEFVEQINEQREDVRVFDEAKYLTEIEDLKRAKAESDDFNVKLQRAIQQSDREKRHLKEKVQAYQNQQPEVIHDTQYIEIEVEKPVPYEVPCFVDYQHVNAVDRVTRVLNEIPYDRVPDDPPTGRESQLRGRSPVTCARFVERITELTSLLGNAYVKHRAMTERQWNQYRLYQEFQKERMDELADSIRPND